MPCVSEQKAKAERPPQSSENVWHEDEHAGNACSRCCPDEVPHERTTGVQREQRRDFLARLFRECLLPALL